MSIKLSNQLEEAAKALFVGIMGGVVATNLQNTSSIVYEILGVLLAYAVVLGLYILIAYVARDNNEIEV